MNTQTEPKVIKASYVLQSRVGAGPLDEEKVKRSQQIIEKNNIDFVPLGLQFLDELEALLQKAEGQDMEATLLREQLTQPVMQLKANASMFKYHLIGDLANIMLSFLESIEEVDQDALEIVRAHHSTLKAIIMKKMTGDGGAHGKAFQNELKQACRRYFTKRHITPSDMFIVDT